MPRARFGLLPLAVAASMAGCGHAGGGAARSGATVFSQECQVCHSLIGNESLRKDGGDLLGYSMSRSQMTSFVREMPVKRRLSSPELRAVVDFVLRAERSRR